jgi:type 1 glutamine amidotransferase
MNRAVLALTLSTTVFAQFQFRDIDAKSVQLTEAGKPVFTYNHGMMLAPGIPPDRIRCCYIYPAYTAQGTMITEDFPEDHVHQRGINWSWANIIFEGKSYDLWNIKGIHARHEKWLAREASAAKAVLAMREGWYVGERKIVEGDVEVTVHPSTATKREMDFVITLRPFNGAQVQIGGAPDHNKGYGGFEIRVAPQTGTVLNTATLADSPDSDMVPNAWAEISGNFAGGRATARITIDPGNPGFPNGWILRHYGLIGANYPGPRPVLLNGPVTMKYRLTFTDEAAQPVRKKVLVYTRNFTKDGKGYVHDNIAASVEAIRKMGRENNFLVDATDDPNFITDARLGLYNTIIFANSNNEAFPLDWQRESFRKFIEAGGGFVGIHSASGSERDNPFFWQTLGGKFTTHPKLQKFTVHVADSNHKATLGMPADFEWEDECYFFEFVNPNIHSLLTVDPAKLDDPERVKYGRTGELYHGAMPLSWTLEQGSSRRFYTALGHKKEHYSNALLYQHILNGILWTLEGTKPNP